MEPSLLKSKIFVSAVIQSGATPLREYLDTHPQIVMSTQKKPAIFFAEESTLRGNEHRHLSLFPQDNLYRYPCESNNTMRDFLLAAAPPSN